jgi:membrane-bound hydrogenase subunit beta
MKDSEIIERIQGLLGGRVLAIANPSERRIFMTVAPGDLRGAVLALRDSLGFAYLATISGVDKGPVFELLYHFANVHVCLTVRTEVPRSEPRVQAVTPVIPGAIFYERELQDMFGIVVEGLSDPRPLLMPDDWPPENYPLRKDWKFTRPEERIPGGRS